MKLSILLFLFFSTLQFLGKSKPPYNEHLNIYIFEDAYVFKGKELSLNEIEIELEKKPLKDRADVFVLIIISMNTPNVKIEKVKDLLKNLKYLDSAVAFLKDEYSKEKIIKEYKP